MFTVEPRIEFPSPKFQANALPSRLVVLDGFLGKHHCYYFSLCSSFPLTTDSCFLICSPPSYLHNPFSRSILCPFVSYLLSYYCLFSSHLIALVLPLQSMAPTELICLDSIHFSNVTHDQQPLHRLCSLC